MAIYNAFFVQGDSAEHYLDVIDQHGPDAAMEEMMEYISDANEPRETWSHGTDDHVFTKTYDAIMKVVLSWNPRIGYVGLEYEIKEN